MILLDLFSGIGGFHLGLERAGFKFSKTYYSEIDQHAIACYKHNFKNIEYVGEVKEIAKTNRYKLIGNAVTVDIVKLVAERIKINYDNYPSKNNN